MIYQWKVSTITREGIEAATGLSIVTLLVGTIVVGYRLVIDPAGNSYQQEITEKGGVEIEFSRELTTAERAKLTAYLKIASREGLVEKTW